MQWYYLLHGQRQGPVDSLTLEDLVREGLVHDSTYVWRDGFAEWQLYGVVKAKAEPAQFRPETAPAPKPESTPSGTSGLHPARPNVPAGGPATGPAGGPGPSSAASNAGSAHTARSSDGIFFFYPVLDALSDGRVIRSGVVIGLKIACWLALAAAVLVALTIIMAASHGTGAGLLGGILFAILLLGAGACVAQICWYRSASVAALGSSRYTIISIFSILSRTAGEAAACSLVGIGVGACLFLWLGPSVPLGLPGIGGIPAPIAVENTFLAGIISLVYLAAMGFGLLILGYFWAESIMLLVDIEQNTRKSSQAAGG